jgi:predicted amidophosphoribosyltransferase
LKRRRSLATAGANLARWSRSAVLDLLFPAACAGCDAELAEADASPFCGGCVGRLKLLRGATCVRCGAAVAGAGARERCYLCRGRRIWFDEAIALGEYDGLLRDWLLAMKHGRGESLALDLAELIWGQCRERLEGLQPDVVAPVPMHWRRRWVHGTNSAELLAERLAQHLRAPLATGLLRRTRHTPPQFSLPPSERPANVRGAFAVRHGYHLREARVLVVDDILTTCSTCNAVARTLKQCGAGHVAVVVAARTLRH